MTHVGIRVNFSCRSRQTMQAYWLCDVKRQRSFVLQTQRCESHFISLFVSHTGHTYLAFWKDKSVIDMFLEDGWWANFPQQWRHNIKLSIMCMWMRNHTQIALLFPCANARLIVKSSCTILRCNLCLFSTVSCSVTLRDWIKDLMWILFWGENLLLESILAFIAQPEQHKTDWHDGPIIPNSPCVQRSWNER